MKAYYRIKPADVYELPNGDMAVCIDWAEEVINRPVGDVTYHVCRRVDVAAEQLNAETVIEKFVRERYSQSEEFALINAYQASVAGIEPDEQKEAEYLDFLRWRKQMRERVKELLSSPKDEEEKERREV